MCCSVLQCVAVCCSVLHMSCHIWTLRLVCRNVLQCVAVRCSVLHMSRHIWILQVDDGQEKVLHMIISHIHSRSLKKCPDQLPLPITRANESYRTLRWVISHIQYSRVSSSALFSEDSSFPNSRCRTCKCVMAHTHTHADVSWHTHTHADVSWHTYHDTNTTESYHTCKWVMSHVHMSNVTLTHESCHTNESCHTCTWVMSHLRMSHVTQMSHVTRADESCQTYAWVMSHVQMSHSTHTKVSSLHFPLNESHCK